MGTSLGAGRGRAWGSHFTNVDTLARDLYGALEEAIIDE